MDCVRRPCLVRVSTKALSSSRIEDSWSILACRDVKIAGSTWAVGDVVVVEDVGGAGAGVVIVVSFDIV